MSSLRNYLDDANKPKHQREQADPRQVKNNAGGFTFQVDDRARLERFVILGTDGGTYYVSERDLTKQNVDWLIELIKRDENGMVIDRVSDISYAGRALRNDTAIFVLELVFQYGSPELKKQARNRFNSIVRTSTHLFTSNAFAEAMGGAWGRARKTAVQQWYTDKSPEQLAYQAVKYRQRDGWTHRDSFRLAHPTGVDQQVGNFIMGKGEVTAFGTGDVLTGFEAMKNANSVKNVLELLDAFPKLPWEAIPTQFHKEPDVWKKLFYNGQLSGQALVRNITRLSRIGAFKDMVFAAEYAAKLTDEEMIQKTRLHPFNYLNALIVHQHGQIPRNPTRASVHYGSDGIPRLKDWNTVPVILDALNEGFYEAFKYVEPSRKRTSINLDVSGSMRAPASGLDMSCAEAGAAMAMAIARSEPYYVVNGFSDGNPRAGYNWHRDVLVDLGISPGMNLTQVLKKTRDQNFGRTNCALPMTNALRDRVEIDTFVVLTDNETWHGKIHPHVALREYRQKMGIDAKLVVVAMTATEFTIADPTDQGMLDVIGMDASVPKLISEFAKGEF